MILPPMTFPVNAVNAIPEKTRDANPADTMNLSLKDEIQKVKTFDRLTETNIAPNRHAIADLLANILL